MNKKQKNSPPFSFALLFGAAIAVSVASGLLLYGCRDKTVATPVVTSPSPNPVFPDPVPTAAPGRAPSTFEVKAGENGNQLVKHSSTGQQTGTPEEIAISALNKMAEIPHSPLPPGTKAKSVVFGKDNTATVDFNEAFVKNFPGGDEAEALALNAVLATLGQFPDVKQVQMLVEGKKVDTLGGNADLTEPMPVPQNIPGLTGADASEQETEAGTTAAATPQNGGQ